VLRKAFFGIWILIFGSIIILTVFPRLILTVPMAGLEAIRVFLILWMLLTLSFGLAWLYRRGMARARK
jgi:hypothetical protein